MNLSEKQLLPWIKFLTSRSSGPGGQNVNKVNSRVELHFDLLNCDLLSELDKEKIFIKLKNKINIIGEIVIVRQTDRSQLKNKKKAIEFLISILTNALKPIKVRKKTLPTHKSVEKRLINKKKQSEKKSDRKKSDY